jgi:hypothetical protein
VTPVEKAIRMLREDRRRDLYEGADPKNSKLGSGQYFVTYSNGEGPTLYRPDVEVLLREGTIRPKWRDASLHCYVLSDAGESK